MIKIEGADKSFESCQDCVHAYDSTEICILRRCIHAFSELRECYKPKKELKPSAQPEPCVDTGILDRFSIYQIEWLRSHNDIEFMPDEEDLIVRFLNDTLHCFKLEHQEKVDTPTVDTPTCEDAVSRQAVYNVLDKMPVRGFKNDGETIHGLISLSQVNSAIINLPSAQPEMNLDEWCETCKEYNSEKHCCPRFNHVIRETVQEMEKPHWIPVTERLPEAGSWAIWCSNKGIIQVARWKIDAIDHFFPSQGFFQLDDAVAWMPLPEPYAERRTDERTD